MPLGKKWSSYTKDSVGRERDNYGVYELGDTNGAVHYIGEGAVKTRLLVHFAGGSDPCPGTKYYRCEYTGSKSSAVSRQNALLAVYKRTHGKLPRYNQRSRN